MTKFCLIVSGLLVSFVLGWCAINFHFFHTRSGLVMSIKRYPTLADTYVDVREWGIVQWSEFPDLAWSLARSGYDDVIPGQPIYSTAGKPQVEISR